MAIDPTQAGLSQSPALTALNVAVVRQVVFEQTASQLAEERLESGEELVEDATESAAQEAVDVSFGQDVILDVTSAVANVAAATPELPPAPSTPPAGSQVDLEI